jgi:hypothetical protein
MESCLTQHLNLLDAENKHIFMCDLRFLQQLLKVTVFWNVMPVVQ